MRHNDIRKCYYLGLSTQAFMWTFVVCVEHILFNKLQLLKHANKNWTEPKLNSNWVDFFYCHI